MIPKLIQTGSYDFESPATSLVPLHSRGVDQNWIVKTAAHGVFHKFLQDFQAPKGKTVIHVIAVGDEEFYGPNRNGDGFSGADNRTAHRSFVDLGHVFKNHKNDDPFKAVGEVIRSAHNAQMNRIELLLGLDNDKCRKEIEALHNGQDIPVSMGSMQDFDVCSICDHKAPTAADHCSHVQNLLGQIMDDGRRVYMKNPNPKYFDISVVFKPADRIAYALRKVAAAAGCVGGHELAEMVGLNAATNPKIATMRALATMYKRIPAHLRKVTEPENLKEASVRELQKKAQIHGIEQLIGFLNSNGWLLGPKDFGKVIGHPTPEACPMAVDQHGSLEDLLEDHTEVKALEAPCCQDQIPLSEGTMSDLASCSGMDDGAVNGRVLKITIIKPTSVKNAHTMDSLEAQGFAALYGHYKLAFANAHSDRPGVLRALASTF